METKKKINTAIRPIESRIKYLQRKLGSKYIITEYSIHRVLEGYEDENFNVIAGGLRETEEKRWNKRRNLNFLIAHVKREFIKYRNFKTFLRHKAVQL